MTIWITGEAELVTVRLADGWNVNKHYDPMSADDLEMALGELAALIAEASVSEQGCYRAGRLSRGLSDS